MADGAANDYDHRATKKKIELKMPMLKMLESIFS